MYSLDVLMQRGYCYVEGNRAVVGYNREVCPICGRYVKCEAILQGETALKIEGGKNTLTFWLTEVALMIVLFPKKLCMHFMSAE